MQERKLEMKPEMEQIAKKLDTILQEMDYVKVQEIPGIDLYMDQVTTFMEEHLKKTARHPETDKILTKTMINNYAKSELLLPPVKKKYNMDHMLLLLWIYYLKSFLSIGDIQQILGPVKEHFTEEGRELALQAQKKKKPEKSQDKKEQIAEQEEETWIPKYTLPDVYDVVMKDVSRQIERIREEVKRQVKTAADSFKDAPDKEQALLQRFDLICEMSAEVYIKKMLIEQLVDELSAEDEIVQK